jgi:hypothetical protein
MAVTAPRALPAEQAARLRRPSWRDTRLLVGLVLVLASVAIGARVVALADDTVPVYAARAALPAGTALSAENLVVARARITGTDGRYLEARDPLPPGRVLLRQVGPGELVPRSAIGSAAALTTRPVTVPIDGAPPAGLVTGALVDVWASERAPGSGAVAGVEYVTPKRIARGVEVFHVAAAGSSLAATSESSVEVLLDEDELPLVLDALANDARTAVVPVPGSAPRSGGEP